MATQAATPAERFAGEIRRYQEAAASVRNTLTARLAELNEIPEFKKLDGPLMTEHLEQVAEAWTEAATALQQGDPRTAAALAERAEKLAGLRRRWEERLHWRRLQAQREYLPATAEVFFMLATERNADLAQEVGAFVAAKQRRSEAYGRLAEATTPTADRQSLFQLEDEVFRLEIEVGVADMKYGWAREDWDFRTWVATDSQVTSPELVAAGEQLAEWRRQREEAYRQSRQQQHALEQLDRQREHLIQTRETAYRDAKKRILSNP